MNPATENPGKVNAEIEILGTKTVVKYKIKTFTRMEKVPNVSKLRGREKMLRIGFKTLNRIARVTPPIR